MIYQKKWEEVNLNDAINVKFYITYIFKYFYSDITVWLRRLIFSKLTFFAFWKKERN